MHRLNQIVSRLQPEEIREVEAFAELLLNRHNASGSSNKSEYLDVDQVAGMLAGLAPEKTAVELSHEAIDARASKYRD